MVSVTGSIKRVTNQPANIQEVWIRAPRGRIQNESYVAELPGVAKVSDGYVSFDALPGAALMVLVSQSRPIGTVKILVPDKPTASLRECIEAAGLADDGTLGALERLASDVAADLARVMDARADAEAARDDAVSAAGEAAGEVRDEFSGMLADAQTAAINATDAARTEVARVVDGAPEDLDTIREVAEYAQENREVTDQLNAAIGNKANKQHTHVITDVANLQDELDKRAYKGALDTLDEDLRDYVDEEIANSSSTAVVSSLPSTPEPGTIYFVTG